MRRLSFSALWNGFRAHRLWDRPSKDKCNSGGLLGWNVAEKSWDCPLHGSRFSPQGEVLQGPTARGCPKGRLAVASSTVGDYLLDRLRQWGVDKVFAGPGDGINGPARAAKSSANAWDGARMWFRFSGPPLVSGLPCRGLPTPARCLPRRPDRSGAAYRSGRCRRSVRPSVRSGFRL